MQIHLNTYGTYLHVQDQLFEIRIKKRKEVEKHQVAAHKVKSIWVGQGIALSSEAIKLALHNNIDIVFLEYNGHPLGRIWHTKLGSTTKIRKRQLEASLGRAAVVWTVDWLVQKLTNQLELVRSLKKHREQHRAYLDEKIGRMEAMLQSIRELAGEERLDTIAGTLRGLEGTAGRLYFTTLSDVLPRSYQFSGRSFRPALDPFNAFLNYGYGILYSRVEKVLMLAGLDPYVGFLHRDDYDHKSMVYDFIEPYRIYVETVVFRLFAARKINQGHTEAITNGVSLNKAGKQLLIEHLNDYLEVQTIRYRGRNQTRANAMQADAHQFANALIEKT